MQCEQDILHLMFVLYAQAQVAFGVGGAVRGDTGITHPATDFSDQNRKFSTRAPGTVPLQSVYRRNLTNRFDYSYIKHYQLHNIVSIVARYLALPQRV